MQFIFTREPLRDEEIPQIAHALRTRIESLSRLKYPAMWERADKAAANDTPEKKASRDKAAAIRHRLWGGVFIALGAILLIPGIANPGIANPGIANPGGLTFPMIIGAAAVLLGFSRLFGKYVSTEEKQNQRYLASAAHLLQSLNRAQASGAPTLIFSEEEMTMRTPNGSEEVVAYTAMEYVIEEEELLLITFGTKITVIRPSEIVEGDIDAFLPFMEDKTSVLYRQPTKEEDHT